MEIGRWPGHAYDGLQQAAKGNAGEREDPKKEPQAFVPDPVDQDGEGDEQGTVSRLRQEEEEAIQGGREEILKNPDWAL